MKYFNTLCDERDDVFLNMIHSFMGIFSHAIEAILTHTTKYTFNTQKQRNIRNNEARLLHIFHHCF